MDQRAQLIAACQERIGYRFKDVALLRAAMTHSSSANSRKDSNERMEFLGDAVLGLVVCHDVYNQMPESLEGDLTKVKSAVVSRRVCARVAEKLALGDVMVLGQGLESGEQLPSSLKACVLEALIAAIYLDGGLEPARDFILRHMQDEIRETIESQHQFNYKSQLQQYAQRVCRSAPQYELLDEKGPDHSKCFEVAVTVGRQRFPGAWGPSKKEAEQKAARLALEILGEVPAEAAEAEIESTT